MYLFQWKQAIIFINHLHFSWRTDDTQCNQSKLVIHTNPLRTMIMLSLQVQQKQHYLCILNWVITTRKAQRTLLRSLYHSRDQWWGQKVEMQLVWGYWVRVCSHWMGPGYRNGRGEEGEGKTRGDSYYSERIWLGTCVTWITWGSMDSVNSKWNSWDKEKRYQFVCEIKISTVRL